MNDRELLAKAAKAIGLRLVTHAPHGGRPIVTNEVKTFGWDPLHNDGEALRLAVKLDLHVQPDARHATPHTRVERHGIHPVNLYEVHGDDADAATRRAIVRAAAAMEGTNR